MKVPFPDALLIPQKATFEVLDKQFVFVVDTDGRVRSRPVSIAAELPHQYIVRDGLEESDRILVEGLRKVRDGDQIAIEYSSPEEVFAKLDLPAE
jgi:membrane fusion protein (multidrug efflux system)